MDQKVNLGFSAPDKAEAKKVATWQGFGDHGMRIHTTHDEGAALDFMMTLSRHLGQNVAPGRALKWAEGAVAASQRAAKSKGAKSKGAKPKKGREEIGRRKIG